MGAKYYEGFDITIESSGEVLIFNSGCGCCSDSFSPSKKNLRMIREEYKAAIETLNKLIEEAES